MIYSTIIMAKNKRLLIIAAGIVGIALIITLVLIFVRNSDDASDTSSNQYKHSRNYG